MPKPSAGTRQAPVVHPEPAADRGAAGETLAAGLARPVTGTRQSAAANSRVCRRYSPASSPFAGRIGSGIKRILIDMAGAGIIPAGAGGMTETWIRAMGRAAMTIMITGK